MLEKLNLADSAALDGAISNIRIFTLGDLDAKLAPTPTAVNKLNEMLQSNTNGGAIDIIWGPDIKLIESNTQVHQFLGEGKYIPHLEQMYVGLGIPPSLSAKGGTGTTNNYISLKFLIKRLEYGRTQLINFWEKQVKWVQKSMRFARPAKIEFDFLDLGDETTEKALLIQLADRNIISDEKLQNLFGYDADMEKTRTNREYRERRTGRRVPKRSAMPDSIEDALEKISLQKGFLTPKQLGVQVENGTENHQTPFDQQLEIQKQKGKLPAQNGRQSRGRPIGTKDSNKRKQKEFFPKIRASLQIWATEAQTKINDILKPIFLKTIKKSNFRQLTAEESKKYEKLVYCVLYSTDAFSNITKTNISKALVKNIPDEVYKIYLNYKREVSKLIGRDLTLDESYKIQNFIYTEINEKKLNKNE